MKQFAILLIFMSFFSCKDTSENSNLTLQHQTKKTKAQPLIPSIDTIPFRLNAHNNIAIQALLNKTDTIDLMFHTAANGITLTKAATKKLHTIKWIQEDTVKSWGGKHTSRFSKGNLLEIQSLKWQDVALWENERSGPTTDGKFGPNLFENKVIEIDFENTLLLLHDSVPNAASTYEKFSIRYENDFMFIEGMSMIKGQNHPNSFLIHSGYGGAVLYDDQFVKESAIGTHIEITEEQALKDSYGNVLITKKGKLPKFSIGSMVFEDLTVGFFEGAIGRQKMSIIGGDLLKRFHIIIDADRKHIYLKTNNF